MSKLVGLSLLGSSSLGAAKTFQISSQQPSNSNSSGSFANLRLFAENLDKEHASVKTNLDLANSKLKKLSEHIGALEEQLKTAYNENAKLKVKHKEEEELWTLCDQLTEINHLLVDHVQNGNIELKNLRLFKENAEQQLRAERRKVVRLTEDKDMYMYFADDLIKNFKETSTANESTIECLNYKLRDLQLELKSNEDRLKDMCDLSEKKEKENSDLISSNKKFAEKLDKAMQEIQSLDNFVKMLTVKLIDLYRQSLTFWEKVIKVDALFSSYFELVQEQNKLATQKAQQHFDRLNSQFLNTTLEKDALQMELKNKISELENGKKFTMAQHAEECHLAEEMVRRLESVAETFLSKKADLDNQLITKLEDKVSETSRLSEIQMQDFQLRCSESDTEIKESIRNLKSEIHKKDEEIDTLRQEIVKHKQHVDSVEKQLNEFSLLQKEQVVLEFKEREKQLEDQRAETQKLLVEAEANVAEAKKQYDQMLASKQSELSRRLKEISEKNDQAINDIRRKYEVEKQECVNLEKEKAEKAIVDMEKKCEEKLSKFEEESKQQLMQIEREHTALVKRLQKENDKKEGNLKSKHCEELKRVRLQAENELKKLLKNQHEAELRELGSQREAELRELRSPHEEELNIQKKRDLPYINVTESSPRILNKRETAETDSVISIPKHSKKVTHHEYEVETSHGRTITKRRKTKSTIMFQDPTKNKRVTPTPNTPKDVITQIKGGSRQNPPKIGGLFSEGSSNPYADDPYTFH